MSNGYLKLDMTRRCIPYGPQMMLSLLRHCQNNPTLFSNSLLQEKPYELR